MHTPSGGFSAQKTHVDKYKESNNGESFIGHGKYGKVAGG